MEYTTITGIKKPVSRLILGTLVISIKNSKQSFALLDNVFKYGCTSFDTAHGYGRGDSERGLGQWMDERGIRDKIVIISKGCHPHHGKPRVTPADLTSDLYDSLPRLKTDYIDLYLLHRDDVSVQVGPIMEILNEHLSAGRIHAFGASNWTHQRIAEANEYAEKHNLQPFAASSPNYGLAEQVEDPWGYGCMSISGPENREAREWYRKNQMPVLAYSSLARGLFSGRITRDNFEKMKSTLDHACLKAYCHERNFKRLDRATQLAKKKNITIPQLALSYILNSPINVFPVIGATIEEFRENLKGSTSKPTNKCIKTTNGKDFKEKE
jgi:aryl-alcohol dehydrogenase-like predicted oxidoreductase